MLYQRLLGQRFKLLPEVLQHFHGSRTTRSAEGLFRVRQGKGLFRAFLAFVLGFPRSGDEIPVRLDVHGFGEREDWTRRFGDQTLKSVQTFKNELLCERVGAFEILQRVEVEKGLLRHISVSARFCGIRLPDLLAPRVQSEVEAGHNGWFVHVAIDAPILGRILEYSGNVKVL